MSRRSMRRRRINSCPFISLTVRITCGQWPLGRVRPHSTIPSPGRGWRPTAPLYWPLGYRPAGSSCGTVAQVCHLYWLFIVAHGGSMFVDFLGHFHLQELVTKIWIDINVQEPNSLPAVCFHESVTFLLSMNIEQEWKWFHSIHSVGTWSHTGYQLDLIFAFIISFCTVFCVIYFIQSWNLRIWSSCLRLSAIWLAN